MRDVASLWEAEIRGVDKGQSKERAKRDKESVSCVCERECC